MNRVLIVLSIWCFGVALASSNNVIEEADRKLDELKAGFKTESQEMLSEIKADEGKAPSALIKRALALEMAENDADQFAVEQKTLLAAKSLVERYFGAESGEQLHEMFAKNEHLAELMLERAHLRSIADALYATEWRMKRIYLLITEYENETGDESSLRPLARRYFERLAAQQARATEIESKMDDAFEAYKAAVDGSLSDEQVSNTIEGVDELIDEAMDCPQCAEENEPLEELDGMRSMFLDDHNKRATIAALVQKFVDADLLADFRSTRAELQKPANELHLDAKLDDESIEQVDLDDVFYFEEYVLQQ